MATDKTKQMAVLIAEQDEIEKKDKALVVQRKTLAVHRDRVQQKIKLLWNIKPALTLGQGRKPCPACQTIVGAPTQRCKNCGHRFLPRKEAIKLAVTRRLKKRRALLSELVTAALECHVVTPAEIKKLMNSLVDQGLVAPKGKDYVWKRRKK